MPADTRLLKEIVGSQAHVHIEHMHTAHPPSPQLGKLFDRHVNSAQYSMYKLHTKRIPNLVKFNLHLRILVQIKLHQHPDRDLSKA